MTERRINVVSPSGARGTLPESEALKAFKDGSFRPESADETADRVQGARNIETRKNAGGEIEALASGAARGAIDAAIAPGILANAAVRGVTGVDVGRKVTGAIDKLTGGTGKEVDLSQAISGGATLENLAAVGGEAAHRAGLTEQTGEMTGRLAGERIRDTAEANPLWDTGGQILGSTVGGIPLSRVAGAAGKGLTGALAAGKVATGAQKVAGAALAGGIEGIGQGAQIASEGAFMGGNVPLTGESIVANIGMGGLLGAGVGGGAAKLGQKLSGAGRAVFGAGKGAENEAIGDVASRVLGTEPAPGLGQKLREAYEGAASVVSGGDRETLGKYGAHRWDDAAMNGREMYLNREPIIRDAAVEMTEAVRAMRKEADEVLGDLSNAAALKRERVAGNLGGVDQPMALGAARENAAALRSKLSQLDDVGTFGPQPWAKGARKYVDDMLGDVMSGASGAADSYVALDSARRQLSALGERAGAAAEAAGFDIGKAEQLQAYSALAKEAAGDARKHLTAESVWGKQAADHAATLQLIDKVANNRNLAEASLLTRVGGTRDAPLFDVDPGKVEAFMGGLGTLKSNTAEGAVKEHLQAVRDLSEQLVRGYDLGAKHGPALERMQKAYGTIEGTLGKAQETVKAANQIDDYLKAEKNGLGAQLGAGAGLLGGSIIGGQYDSSGAGAALGLGASALLRPGAALMQAARLQSLAGGTAKRMRQALGRFFGHAPLSETMEKGVKAAGKAATAASSAPRRAATVIASEAATADAPKKRRETVAHLAANPQVLASRVQEMIGDSAAHLPMTEAAMSAVPMRAVQYLASKLPPSSPPVAFDGSQDAPVSDEDQDRFDEHVKGVSDPLGALDDMAKGTLTPERVEAIQSVYPELYKEMATAMFDYVAAAAEAKKPLQYQRRLQADLMFGGGGTIEPSLAPEFMRTIEQASQAGGKAPAAPKRARSGAPNIAQHHQSPLDKINL